MLENLEFDENGILKRHHVLNAKVFDNDTIPYIQLAEVDIWAKKTRKQRRREIRYNKLRRDVLKVYPFARAAAIRLEACNRGISNSKTKKERKAYMKEFEGNLWTDFEKDLRKMTFRQGRILIRLIDREIGSSSYDILKDYKGKVAAVFWQTVARIFGSNLKWEYDTEEQEDIEKIIKEIEDQGLVSR
ncbi:DUF4294 domain-containing protein [Bacteroidales bacterium AH-315-N07]|nr:DUF4294 domain-containing protein [Bacteroidales bacterium AH-315-N07]